MHPDGDITAEPLAVCVSPSSCLRWEGTSPRCRSAPALLLSLHLCTGRTGPRKRPAAIREPSPPDSPTDSGHPHQPNSDWWQEPFIQVPSQQCINQRGKCSWKGNHQQSSATSASSRKSKGLPAMLVSGPCSLDVPVSARAQTSIGGAWRFLPCTMQLEGHSHPLRTF